MHSKINRKIFLDKSLKRTLNKCNHFFAFLIMKENLIGLEVLIKKITYY